MKHWRPETRAVPLDQAKRRRRRDWTGLDAYAPPRPRPRAHEVRSAGCVGLAVVAAACLALGVGAHVLLSQPKAVDRAVFE